MRPPSTSLVLSRPKRIVVVDDSTRPLRLEVVEYLIFKRKRLTSKSARGYRSILTEFVNAFDGFVLQDFHPPAGGALIEEFLERRWGQRSPRTYNKSFSVINNFFDWELRRGRIPGDPMLMLERAKPRPFHRTTFTDEQRLAIMLAATDERERIALRLLFDYGIRKGALQNVQLEHFDRDHHQVTIFTKGETIQVIPLPDDTLWADLATLDSEPGNHYLIPKQLQRRRKPRRRKELLRLRELLDEAQMLAEAVATDEVSAREAAELALAIDLAAGWLDRTIQAASAQVRRFHDEQIGEHGMHDLWYRWLARAGIVPKGITHGARMHGARHTAAQRMYDLTGNVKAASVMLGHKSSQVTEMYIGHDTQRLERDLREMIERDRARRQGNGNSGIPRERSRV